VLAAPTCTTTASRSATCRGRGCTRSNNMGVCGGEAIAGA
jgi:hypothetical protein